MAGRARTPAVLLGLLAVFAAHFAGVRSTNFGGADEWLYVELASRGVLSLPTHNRPLTLIWAALPSSLWPHHLAAYHLANAAYLFLSGVFLYLVLRRLLPAWPRLAFLAAAFAPTWAPNDYLRLDSVLITGYSGFGFGTVFALFLFFESYFRRSGVLLAASLLVAAAMSRGVEAVLPLLCSAPVLLFAALPRRPRRFWVFGGLWALMAAASLALAAVPLLTPGADSYQAGALGLDPHPLRVGARLLDQYRLHLLPLLDSRAASPHRPEVAAAAAAFLLAYALAARLGFGGAPEPEARGTSLRALGLLVLGLALAALGYGVILLSPAVRDAARMQLLSSPGMALALAALVILATRLAPPASRHAVAIALGGFVVAVGTGRTLAMQEEWDGWRSAYPAQHRALSGIVAQAPGLRPHTLVLLLDEAGAFRFAFTFRHAIEYLYGGRATGYVPGAHPYLYPAGFVPDGFLCEPWPAIRGPWGARPTLHGAGEIVVFRASASGNVSLEESWPEGLPPLPDPAAYLPRDRILRAGPRPPAQAILGAAGAQEPGRTRGTR